MRELVRGVQLEYKHVINLVAPKVFNYYPSRHQYEYNHEQKSEGRHWRHQFRLAGLYSLLQCRVRYREQGYNHKNYDGDCPTEEGYQYSVLSSHLVLVGLVPNQLTLALDFIIFGEIFGVKDDNLLNLVVNLFSLANKLLFFNYFQQSFVENVVF